MGIKRLWILDLVRTQQIQTTNHTFIPSENYWLCTTNTAIFSIPFLSQDIDWPYVSVFYLETPLTQGAILTWSNLLSGITSEFQPNQVFLESSQPFLSQTLQLFLKGTAEIHLLFSEEPSQCLTEQLFSHDRILWHCWNSKQLNYLMSKGVSAASIFPEQGPIGSLELSPRTPLFSNSIFDLQFDCTLPYLTPKLPSELDGTLEIEQDIVIFLFIDPIKTNWKEYLDKFTQFFHDIDSIAQVIIPLKTVEKLNQFDIFYPQIEDWFTLNESSNKQLPEIILLDPDDFSGWSGFVKSGIFYIDGSLNADEIIQYVINALSNDIVILSDNESINQHLDSIFDTYIISEKYSNQTTCWRDSYSSAKCYKPDPQAYYLWNLYVLKRKNS